MKTKEFGGHADEIETSNILAVKPEWVHMDKAVNDSSGKGGAGPLTPVPVEGGLYVPSGINGYAALGTAAKGKKAIKAFTEELIREIDSISTCPLPLPTDNTAIYKQYEGTYTSGSGINLIISQKDNKLYFVINKRDLRNFYWLIKSSEDYYSSMFIDVLFVKDEKGKFTKAWCRLRGEGFWMTKQ
ncbi:MAG: creatininase family protein [Chitinophagaceae bacterium]|nr:creatininase family protein [Chitinophagaceae bacterium]